MSDAALLDRPSDVDGAAALRFVDCDIHPIFPVDEIFKRMSKRALRGIYVSNHETGAAREHNQCLFPTGSALRLDARPPAGGSSGSDASFTVENWLDPQRIDAALMMPMQGYNVIPWGNDEGVQQFLSALNDYFLDEWYTRDHRFRTVISVSPHDPDAAVQEIERLADRPGVTGISIPMAEIGLGRASLLRLYEAAAYHRLPILLHPTGAEGCLMNSPGNAGGLFRTYPEVHTLLMQTGQGACAALVMSGMLAKVPDLRIVFAEFGYSWAPPLMWRLDAAWNRAGGPDGCIDRPPSAYLLDQIRFTTQPLDECVRPEDNWPLLDALQAERTLLFSSDYPHWDTDNPASVFTNRIPSHLYRRIAYDNAVDTFGERLWS